MRRLRAYFDALRAHYGRTRAAESETPFEPIVRAIVGQGAPPKGLEKALHTLRVYGLMTLEKIRELDPDTIAMAIKPAGSAGAKAARLKTFAAWFADRFGADPERLKALPPHQLREELLGIGGVGPQTADLILQQGLGLPTAVVDTPTYRVFTRHELVVEDAGYEDLKELVEKGLDREDYRDFHTLTGQVGREFCRPKARCENCPLKPLLPRPL